MIYKVCLTILEFYIDKMRQPGTQLKKMNKIYNMMHALYSSMDEESIMKICSELKFLSVCFQDLNIF